METTAKDHRPPCAHDPRALRRGTGALVLVTHRGDWCPFCCGQLVRLAAEDQKFHRRGAEVVAVGVDEARRSAALAARWNLPFPVVSDPGGERWLRPLGLWNPDEHGGIAAVATVVFAPDGREVLRRMGRDVADRPDHDELFTAIERLALPALDLAPLVPEAPAGVDAPGAFPSRAFSAYFNGVAVAAGAIRGRLPHGEARREAGAVARLARSYLEAWDALRHPERVTA